MQVNSPSKRKRGTASERLEILEKDFTLEKLFKSNNIEVINLIDFFYIYYLNHFGSFIFFLILVAGWLYIHSFPYIFH